MTGRVAVAMSGGVDSSLAAAILKRSGHEVVGITFKTWPKEECGESFGRACCSLEAITRARAVAEDLGIPYYVYDLSKEFKNLVIDYFCDEYIKGNTPNPCIICNERIKFALLLEKAKALNIPCIATGHYAKVESEGGRFLLKKGRDKRHDQSYFLFSLSQEQLRHSIFPLADFTKDQTRRLAKKFKLKTFNTASSQDICFVQDQDYGEYIKEKTGVEIKRGEIIDKSGKLLGHHRGIPFYTIGQRRGLGISHKRPLYVIGIDIHKNRLIVGEKEDILKKGLIAHRLNWIAIEDIEKPIRLQAKIRYNHKKANAVIKRMGAGLVKVNFDELQEAPTPGQAVVFYDGDTVVGGGWIREAV